jgi:hypothetical protein
MTSTNAVVETLMCDRKGSNAAPKATADTTPTIEPARRLRTTSVSSETRQAEVEFTNEEKKKSPRGI